jgi:mRNA interferase MazF
MTSSIFSTTLPTSSASPEPATLQRGDIVLVADRRGVFTGKPRPAVVVQSPLYAETATVTVCLVTSVALDAPLLRIALPVNRTTELANRTTGLVVPCWAAVDHLATVRRSHVNGPIGHLGDDMLHEIDRAILMFLGFADHWAGLAE